MRWIYVWVLSSLVATPLIAADHWPQYRGPHGNGISDSQNVPITWSETENIRWKVPIHDKGWSSPVVWGDQIWLTTARADGKAFYAMCLDLKTGKVIHDKELFTETNPAFCHDFNSYASPTPAIEEGRVYVHFGSHGTLCLDTKTADILWERKDLKCDHYRGPGSSVTLYKDWLFLIFDGFDVQYVVALDKKTGQTVWKKDRGIAYTTTNGDLKKAYATPAILEIKGHAEVICPSAEATQAFDPATGEEIWRVTHGGMNAAARPVFGNGLIYLTSGHNMNLLAVKQGLRGKIDKDGIAWRVIKGVPTRPSLLLLKDLLFMVSDNGIASCLDAKTGKTHWQERISGDFSASPVYANGHIYFADQNGKTYVIAADKTFKQVALNRLPSGCMASPAIVGDNLLLRTKTHLYCIGKP